MIFPKGWIIRSKTEGSKSKTQILFSFQVCDNNN